VGQIYRIAALAAALGAASLLTLLPVAAQDPPAEQLAAQANGGPPPPDLAGEAVLDDPLQGVGVLGEVGCPTGRNEFMFAGDGLHIRIGGRCTDASTTAGLLQVVNRLIVPDGEVQLEYRPLAGAARARVTLWVRRQPNSADSYSVAVEPGAGLVQLERTRGGQVTVLSEWQDGEGLLDQSEWTRLGVRLLGPDLWVLINDQAVLHATDDAFASGGIAVSARRLGALGDAEEVAVALRNLRVTALADSDQANRPDYPPPGAPTVSRIYFTLERNLAQRAELDVQEVPVGAGRVYAWFDYSEIYPPGKLRACNALNRRVTSCLEAFTPGSPTGIGEYSFPLTPDMAGGTYTLVVELDGQRLARRDIQIR
jgi:hypothetical protein